MNNNNYIEIYIYLSYNNHIISGLLAIYYKCKKCKYIDKLNQKIN